MKTAICFCIGVVCVCVVSTATAQPAVDRVLDRVQRALDEREQPTPADQPAVEAEELPAAGNEPGYLGVIADDRNEQGQGVRVLNVVAAGPAANGGLAEQDLIIAIDGQPVTKIADMGRILSAMPAGSDVTFSVMRGDDAQDVKVTLGARPPRDQRPVQEFGRQPIAQPGGAAPALGQPPKLGVRTLPITDAARRQFNLTNREGAVVVAVTKGSAAERAGIPVGSVITNINGQPVRDPNDLTAHVAKGGDLNVIYVLEGRPTRVKVTMPTIAARPPAEGPAFAEPAPADAADVNPLNEPENLEDDRLAGIERRLQQMEDRLEKLEAALDAKPE